MLSLPRHVIPLLPLLNPKLYFFDIFLCMIVSTLWQVSPVVVFVVSLSSGPHF